MENKFDIFGIELNRLSAKDAMKRVIQYMEGETISAIEVVTLEMLIQGQENPAWKEQIKAIDVMMPGEKEILEAAGITDRADIRDLENRMFFKLFLKYLQKNKKKLFLLAAREEELQTLEESLGPYKKSLTIVGQAILPEDGSRNENVINEINGVEPDCVISVLPSPWQEMFISENRALLNARIWLGMGLILQKDMEKKPVGKLRHFLLKRVFRYQVEQQHHESN